MIPGPITNQILVETRNSTIFTGPAAATMVATHVIPTGGSYLRVDVGGGTSNSGTITITGDVDGVSTLEIINYSAARWKITTNKFDAGTPVLQSSGLANETVVPTVTIDCCDAAGNKVDWENVVSLPCRIRKVAGQGFAFLAQVKQAGLSVPGIYEVLVPGNPSEIIEGVEFTIVGMRGTFIVFGQVNEHMQIGTNYVDYVSFFATKRSD